MKSGRLFTHSSTAAAITALCLFGAQDASAGSPSFTVSGQSTTLLADSMLVDQLRYAGASTFSTAGGQVAALEFTLTSATSITALKSFEPCHDVGNGLQLIYVVESDGATVSGGIDLFASELAYTDGSGTHDWTVASPPPSTGLLDDGVTITAVRTTVLGASIPSLTTTGQRTYAAFCGTGGTATPSGPLGPGPTPSVSPSPAPSGSPTPSPAPGASPSPSPAPQPSPTATPSSNPLPGESPMPLP